MCDFAITFARLIDMTKTDENLKTAFAGESQANRRYLAFALKAEEEGFTQIAKLFKAAAEAEAVHALIQVRITGQVKSTLENLSAAVSGETAEFKSMYPEFIDTAKKEGKKPAVWSFEMANEVEKVHANLFQKALDAMNKKKPTEDMDYYICGVCGNTVEGSPPDNCPICGAPKWKFYKSP